MNCSKTVRIKTLLTTKVYKHTEGNANPQKLTEPYFRVNIIFTMLATSQIHFVRLHLYTQHKKLYAE